MSSIEFQLESSGIATLAVNRPEVRNALDWEAMYAFSETLQRIDKSPDVRALIITGRGSTFIAGGDMKALASYDTRRDGLRVSRLMGKALERLRALPFPSIAAINGPARGGGAEIAAACDMRVMARDASIGFVQASLGIATGWGGARYLLHMIGYPKALELLATGRVLSGEEAEEIGLVNLLAAPGGAVDAAYELARQIAQHPVEAVRAAKRLLRFALTAPLTAKSAERQLFAALWASDFKRKVVAERFLQKKPKG
ncbi:MAG: enoyl-CoA hydratase/isomerase family protein [Anaerolineales bacterium]